MVLGAVEGISKGKGLRRRGSAAAPIFRGFEKPTYTPIPNDLFDVLMSELAPAELKITLYVARRTFGFKKGTDRISASQFERGIIKSDGQVLDYGTGLSRRAIYLALDSLTKKGILLRNRHSSVEHGDEPNEYGLNIVESIGTVAIDPQMPDRNLRFVGVRAPSYTLTPDEVFDVLLYVLSPAEIKVLLYVVRRTFGFNKFHDQISLSQFVRGIVRRDGSTLDSGTGLTRRTIQSALDSLVQKRVLLRRRYRGENGDEPSDYALNVIGVDPWPSTNTTSSASSSMYRQGSGASSLSSTGSQSMNHDPRFLREERVTNADGGVQNIEGSVIIAGGGVSSAVPGASINQGGRDKFIRRVKRGAPGGLQILPEPECNEDAHNIQKNKKQFDKSLITIIATQLPNLKRPHVEDLVADIIEVTGDRSSRNFFFKLAWNLPEEVIRTALSDTRDEKLTGRIHKNPGAFFVDWLKRIAKTRGLKMP